MTKMTKARPLNKNKYFVYCGFVGPDNYDASEGPIYSFTEYSTKQEVLNLKKDFDECVAEGGCSNIIFKVIYGQKKILRPLEKVIEYEII